VSTKAAATATFGFAKTGHLSYPGRSLTGALKVIEIGIPPHVAEAVGCRQHLIIPDELKKAFPPRLPTAHKGHTGHVLILAGSPGKTGAAAMAANTAMRAGAGLVTLGVPRSLHSAIETMVVEPMTVGLPETPRRMLDEKAADIVLPLIEDKRCLAVGPGIGTEASTGRLLARLIETSPVPMVIDADGLNLIAADIGMLCKHRAPIVLTPHPGEMARLCGHSTNEIQQDRIATARTFAEKFKVHLVLKGAGTVVSRPDGTVFINATGNPGMAAGGMGDVLTGLIAGLIAQGLDVSAAARAAVYLHGAAADRLAQKKAPAGYLATEVMDRIPEKIHALQSGACGLDWPQLDDLTYPTAANDK
jgi:NAD(P)H-hydrate epimerase